MYVYLVNVSNETDVEECQVFTDIDPAVLASDVTVMELVSKGVPPSRPGPLSRASVRGLDDTLWNILLLCWDVSPAARPSMVAVANAFDVVKFPGCIV